ncbi:putative Exonuclease 3'-5' domain-containing protein 1 [Lasiodiplodia theobromae]|nr:putative Exonuclease 3'-5' domain-containing protein 1 [Lasiodiplodia theobromae]
MDPTTATQSIPDTVLNDVTTLQSFLKEYANLPEETSSTIYANLEGIKLGRKGSISIISLFVPSLGRVYHVDLISLGDAVLSTEPASGTSLKTILESPAIKKMFFDVRNDSDALFAHHQISLRGVIDVQLMELATRTYYRRHLASLAKCVEGNSAVAPATKEHWRSVAQIFDLRRRSEELSGRHIINIRPIDPLVLEFCKLRVVLLPHLWRVYSNKLRAGSELFWRSKITFETEERVKLARSATYDGDSKNKVLGPWDWYGNELDEAIWAWNDDLLDDIRIGDAETRPKYESVLFNKSEADALSFCNGGC